MKIKIFKENTYPPEIESIRGNMQVYLEPIKNEIVSCRFIENYIKRHLWIAGHPINQLIKHIEEALMPHDIVCFHLTRLANKEITSAKVV